MTQIKFPDIFHDCGNPGFPTLFSDTSFY